MDARDAAIRYRSFFRHLEQGCCEVELLRDADGRAVDRRYIELNPAFERLFGIPDTDLRGRTASEVFRGREPWWHETFERVAEHGRFARVGQVAGSTGRSFEVSVHPVGRDRLILLYEDVTERRQTEEILRQSEARQAFLLTLGDAMRAQSGADAIIASAARLLGERLNASRILFAEFDEERGVADIFFGWFADGAEPFPVTMRLEDYEGPILDDLRAGRSVRVEDAGAAPSERPDLVAIAELGVKALLSVPLILGGRLVVNLSVHQHEARRWTDAEAALAGEVAERLWADLVRARAETALRDSERRLRTLVEGIPQMVWRAGEDGARTWSSSRWTAYTGQSEPESRGDGWLAAVHPADRAAVLAEWRGADVGGVIRSGHRLFHAGENRHRRVEAQALPVRDADDRIVEWVGTMTDVEDLRRAQKQELFIAELQHRGRNLLVVVSGIAGQMLASGGTLEEFGAQLDRRLAAIGRVQGLLSRDVSARVTVGELVRMELAAHGAGAGDRVELRGAEVTLPFETVQMLALALHELMTNALKHGALAVPGGRLSIGWDEDRDPGGRRLRLRWREGGVVMPEGDAAERRRGFGLELIERSLPYELDAETELAFEPDGLHCSITLRVDGEPDPDDIAPG